MKRIFGILIFGIVFSAISAQTTEPKEIVLAWDSSLSMENRVVENDFKFLDNYFSKNKSIQLTLVLFSNDILQSSDLVISNGNWEKVREILVAVTYDGATNLHAVESVLSLHHNELLLFTDGGQTYGSGIPVFGIKTFVVNSNPKKDATSLQNLVIANKARLFDYTPAVRPDRVFQETGEPLNTHAKEDVQEPASANIRLDEVTVTQTATKKEEERTVNTAFGKVNSDRIGVATTSMSDKEISPGMTDVSQALQSRFAGVDLKSDQDISQVRIRTSNSMLYNNYGLVVIDGVPQRQSDSSGRNPNVDFGFLDPENIADITVLKGLAATTRFGTQGANGVVLITTKTAVSGSVTAKNVDKARLTDNVYEGTLQVVPNKMASPWIHEFGAFGNTEKAYQHYIFQRKSYLNSPSYFLDHYDYFKGKSEIVANRILSCLAELFPDDIAMLRILAYKWDLEGNAKAALKVYGQIHEQNRESLQAQLDLAMALHTNKMYAQSYEMLGKLYADADNGSDNYGFISKTVDNAIRGIVHDPDAKLVPSVIAERHKNVVRYGARILIMWNKGDAEFELQIINPQKRFFKWEHSELSDPQRHFLDRTKDISTEEFHLLDSEQGDWYIKANSLMESTPNSPVYLKCIVFYDFGTPNQRQEIQLLEVLKGKETLFKITVE